MSRTEKKIIPLIRNTKSTKQESATFHFQQDRFLHTDSPHNHSQRHATRMLAILFTDLVGSAAVKSESGIHKAQTLELAHKEILMAALKQIRTVYQDNTAQPVRVEGDSYIFIFSNPSHAVHFALLAQTKHREARAKQWPDLPEFRIGIDLGEVIVEEGLKGPNMPGGVGDIKGLQADMTARIMGLAQGGQILCSSAAYDNAKQALTGMALEGFYGKPTWKRHGRYLLKGRDETVEICEVGEEGIAPFQKPAGSGKAKPVRPEKTFFNKRWMAAAAILFIAAFLFFPLYRTRIIQKTVPSASPELHPAEAAVDEIKYKIIRLHSDFESIDDYGDRAAREVREKAPRFGSRLLNLADAGMGLKHRILKYQFATFSFAMAAWTEPDQKEKIKYADQALDSGRKTLALIHEAEKNASDGGEADQALEEWIVSNYRKESVHYFLAVSFAIKVRNGDKQAAGEAEKHINAIPSSYKARYPLEEEPNLKWFLEKQKTNKEE